MAIVVYILREGCGFLYKTQLQNVCTKPLGEEWVNVYTVNLSLIGPVCLYMFGNNSLPHHIALAVKPLKTLCCNSCV
jgi:hypothetical protein